jgi:tRNA N6-adenosine threonylcarbamoyltransferase
MHAVQEQNFSVRFQRCDRCHQRIGISRRRDRLHPQVSSRVGRFLPNRNGTFAAQGQRLTGDPHGILRCEHQDLKGVGIDREGNRANFYNRGNYQIVRAKQTLKGAGLRLRAGQQNYGAIQSQDCPRRVDRAAPRCYLPVSRRATGGTMTKSLTILGLESSCDDTAAAVVRADDEQHAQVLSSVVLGQTDLHADFGGVVPEIAARAHAEKLDLAVEQALTRADLSFADVDAIAVTAGPGLIGGVLAGVMCAKGLAAGSGKPLIGVNHLAGHALTPRLTDGLQFPYLMLLVSGGHCQFLLVHGADRFHRLGGTIDDAPGEAFDKVARMLGLAQPGGPAVEAEAKTGNPDRFDLPRPLLDRPGCDMSFSGLKTAVLRRRNQLIDTNGGLARADRADLCAAFQAAVCDVFAVKSARALREYWAVSPQSPAFAVAGGVAANQAIRIALETVSRENQVRFVAPPLALCTDNAAMIAWAGLERFRAGQSDDMKLGARPRWPLDTTSPALLGSGKKGAKA